MEKKNVLTRGLAITGTALVWLPIIVPILLAIVMSIARGKFLLDYLMPMELFFLTIIDSALLLWAAFRAHSRVKLIAWGIGIAAFLFFGVQGFATITGLASGETEPVGWMWIAILAMIAIYTLTLILIGTGGALLLKDLFKKGLSPA